MDLSFSEEQERYRDSVVSFARRDLDDDVAERDVDHAFSREGWQKCADFGLLGLPVPDQYGGSGADPITIAVALEALGYGCRDNGLLFSLNAHLWSCVVPVMTFGTEEQKARYLPGLCDGSIIGVQGMTEPGSGSDAFGMATTVERRGDDFVLNGSKTYITNAPVADLFVVFASSDSSRGFAGTSTLLVERGTPGLTIGKPFEKMGLRTSPMSELAFSDVRLPPDALLGTVGAGMAVFNNSMEWERSFIMMSTLGTMQRQLERSVAYARERRQFGQPISKFQAVSHRLVEMRLRLKTARLLLYELAWLRSLGKSAAAEASLAKLHVSKCFLESSLDALYVHGAFGYMVEAELERDVRDAIAGQIYSGTSDIQRNLVAARMGL